MRPDEDRLPVHEPAAPLAHVEHVQPLRLVGRLPLLRLGHAVATRTELHVERHGRPVRQHLPQGGLVLGHPLTGAHLEQVQREHLWVGAEEGARAVRNHLQELGYDVRAGVELDVRREDEVGLGGLAGHVATNIHRVEELLLGLVHLVGGDVEVGRRLGAVEGLGEDAVALGYLEY